MKKLKDLHEKVKKHPYRLHNNNKYLKSYKRILEKFFDAFYKRIKNIPMDCKGSMIHELLSLTFSLGFDYKDNTIDNGQVIITLEQNIGCIHKYILTGKFDVFYTYYTGCNYNKKLGRKCKITIKDNGKSKWVHIKI